MFGKFGVWELVIILVIVLVLFGGRGKISGIMGDVGSGLKAFKKSVKDDENNLEVEVPSTENTHQESQNFVKDDDNHSEAKVTSTEDNHQNTKEA